MARGPKPTHEAHCPEPTHFDAKVVADGNRQTALGLRRRFRCRQHDGAEDSPTPLSSARKASMASR